MTNNNILTLAQEILPDIVQWRRHIHQNAELSFEEKNTCTKICQVLKEYGIDYQIVANTGVLAKLSGANPKQPIVLRADMDALPIVEQTELDYACKTGAMHACGHDVHSAALLGALVILKKIGHKNEVWGLFQPGEELHPGGASMVINEGTFDGVEPIFVGQHCSPELPTGTIGLKSGQFMASTDEIHITVNGRGGHGAMPHKAADAVLACSAMIMAMQQITARGADPLTPTVLSFGRVIANGATNILPDKVLVEGTFRTMNNHQPNLTDRVRKIAQDMIGQNGEVIEIPMRMTAEDFGFYAEKYPACFARLGVGNGGQNEPALHTSKFNPNENALAYGAAFLAAAAIELK